MYSKTIMQPLICLSLVLVIGLTTSTTGSSLGESLEDTIDNSFDPSTTPTFVNNLKRTSLSNLKHYVHYAFAIYCSDKLVTWTCKSCQALGSNVRYITQVVHSPTGGKAYFAIDDTRQEIVLSFRGAWNLPNVLLAIDFTMTELVPNSDIQVETGFFKIVMSLYHNVAEELKKLTDEYPGYKVIITGHSIGGAQAALTLFLFNFEGIFPYISFELYTYGAPRIGNREFADYFNSLDIPVARGVNNADLVPHIGTTDVGYVHHQNEVWIVGEFVRNCSTTTYEDEHCSYSQAKLSASDHLHYFEADYITCLLEDTVNTALQAVVDLKPYVPLESLEKLGLNKINLLPLDNVIRPVENLIRSFNII